MVEPRLENFPTNSPRRPTILNLECRVRQNPRDISDQVINDKVSVGSDGKTVGVKEVMCGWDSDDVTVRKGKTVVAGGGGVAACPGANRRSVVATPFEVQDSSFHV